MRGGGGRARGGGRSGRGGGGWRLKLIRFFLEVLSTPSAAFNLSL